MLAQRLHAQFLATPAPDVASVGRRLLGMQGQDLAAVKWALGVRVPNATEALVEAAFNDRSLVRSWPLRGTLHVVPAEELLWLTALTSPRSIARQAKRHRDLGLTDADFTKARALAEKSLEPGPLTREALLGVFDAARLSTKGQRGVHLLWMLAQWGVICLGDFLEGEQRFVLTAKWLRSPRRLDGDEALGELARRYVEGHGPSSDVDLAWWCGLSLTEARRGLEIARVKPSTTKARIPRALLLPGFDEYFLGYAARGACLDAKYFERVVPGGNGVFQPMVVLDGVIQGTWKRRVTKKNVRLTLLPFTRFTVKQRQLIEGAAQAFGHFHGKPVVIDA